MRRSWQNRQTGYILSALLSSAILAGCNGSSVLTPNASQTKTESLVGTKSGNLRVVALLQPPEYAKLGVSQLIFKNDLLHVDVFQVNELDRKIRVDNRGDISMPLIGTVKAAGRSVTAVEDELKRRYGANYLQSPEISVSVLDSSGQKVIIDGAFRRPGVFRLSSHTTLIRLVAEAGGLTPIADENKLFVYRKFGKENHVAQYSVADIRNGKTPDPTLYAGDLVVAFPSNSKIAFNNIKDALGLASSAARVATPF